MLQGLHCRIVRGDVFLSGTAALPRRNGRAVRAGLRMAQECANLVGGFGREDVLELARLLLDLGFAVEREAVGEQTFREPVTPDDIPRPLASAIREADYETAVANGNTSRLQRV